MEGTNTSWLLANWSSRWFWGETRIDNWTELHEPNVSNYSGGIRFSDIWTLQQHYHLALQAVLPGFHLFGVSTGEHLI